MRWPPALVAVLAPAGPAAATPGSLDPSFGDGGLAVLQAGDASLRDVATSIAVTPAGKALVGGMRDTDGGGFSAFGPWTLARLGADGRPDQSFGDAGIASDGPAGEGILSDLAVDGDGVVAVGATCDAQFVCDATVARYGADGTLDPDFGTDGVLRLGLACSSPQGSSGAGLDRITPTPSGWVVSGNRPTTCDGSGHSEGLLVRVTPGGELDHGFSGDGIVTDAQPLATPVGVAGNVVVMRGKQLVRYTAAGALDVSYTITDPRIGVTSLLALPDGRVAAGGLDADERPAIAMSRAGGGLDPVFGNQGVAANSLSSLSYAPTAIARQADGELVLAGLNKQCDWRLSRVSPSGTADPNFGRLGTARVTIGGDCGFGVDIASGPDRRLLVTGSHFIVAAVDGRASSDFPDSDADGTRDYNDDCPSAPGPIELSGCAAPVGLLPPAPQRTPATSSTQPIQLPRAVTGVRIRALPHGRLRVGFTADVAATRVTVKVVARGRTVARRTAYARAGRHAIVLKLRRTKRGRTAVAKRALARVLVTGTAPAHATVRLPRAVRLRR